MASLYEADLYAWTQDQADKLRKLAASSVNSELDLENLAEEIDSVGRSDRRELHSRLARIIEHLLKLGESTLPEPRRGWQNSVRAERESLDVLLDQSPSLRPVAETEIPAAHARAVRRLKDQVIELGMDPLPMSCPYDIDQILDADWWPEPRDR
jgi:hypothetical protein